MSLTWRSKLAINEASCIDLSLFLYPCEVGDVLPQLRYYLWQHSGHCPGKASAWRKRAALYAVDQQSRRQLL
jgi:hypothetical protein